MGQQKNIQDRQKQNRRPECLAQFYAIKSNSCYVRKDFETLTKNLIGAVVNFISHYLRK